MAPTSRMNAEQLQHAQQHWQRRRSRSTIGPPVRNPSFYPHPPSPTSARSRRPSLSVLDRLPPELLSCIFLKSVEEASHDALLFPTTIAAVNRHCRQVACATQQLWTRITLTSAADDFALDRLWVHRSGTASLDVTIDLRSGDGGWDEDEECIHSAESVVRRMRILFPHFARCRVLRVYTDTWDPMWGVLGHLKDVPAAPRLVTLELVRANEDAPHRGLEEIFPTEKFVFMSPVLPFKGNVPALKELVLSGVHTAWAHSAPLVRGLAHLNLSYHAHPLRPPLDVFRNILAASQDTLRSLRIAGSGPKIPNTILPRGACRRTPRPATLQSTSGLQPLMLLRLEYLQIGYHRQFDAVDAVSEFFAPNTRHLTVEDNSRTIREIVDGGETLRAIPQRVLPPAHRGKLGAVRVESVLLRRVYARVEDFIEFFRSLPRIEEVMLDMMRPEAVEALTVILTPLKCSPAQIAPSSSSPSPLSSTGARPPAPCPCLRSIVMRAMEDDVKTQGSLHRLRATAAAFSSALRLPVPISIRVERPPVIPASFFGPHALPPSVPDGEDIVMVGHLLPPDVFEDEYEFDDGFGGRDARPDDKSRILSVTQVPRVSMDERARQGRIEHAMSSWWEPGARGAGAVADEVIARAVRGSANASNAFSSSSASSAATPHGQAPASHAYARRSVDPLLLSLHQQAHAASGRGEGAVYAVPPGRPAPALHNSSSVTAPVQVLPLVDPRFAQHSCSYSGRDHHGYGAALPGQGAPNLRMPPPSPSSSTSVPPRPSSAAAVPAPRRGSAPHPKPRYYPS